MLKLTKRDKKRIKKFGKLRFKDEPMYKEKVLLQIYEKSDKEKRKELDEEMNMYFEVIDSGDLKAGQSILELPFAEHDSEAKEVVSSDGQ